MNPLQEKPVIAAPRNMFMRGQEVIVYSYWTGCGPHEDRGVIESVYGDGVFVKGGDSLNKWFHFRQCEKVTG